MMLFFITKSINSCINIAIFYLINTSEDMALHTENKRNGKNIFRDLICVVLLLIADLASKYYIFSHSIRQWIISPVLNGWAARSVAIPVPVLIAISIVVIAAWVYIYYKKYIPSAAFVLLFSGAIWNIYDRIALWGVRDRISISSFPVFNIADICITLGVLWIAFQYKQQSRKERAK